MYRHLKVTSLSQMNNEIIKFLADLLGISDNTDIIKIKSKNGNNVMWFVKDPSRGGLATWIGDISESGNPWENDSTVGAAGKYRLDMWRKEIDAGETASAKAKLNSQNQKGYNVLLEEAENANDKLTAYLIWYRNNKKIAKDIEVYEDVCHRMETTNPCHLGGLLKYSEVPASNGFKWLDCLYKDNTFMFSLYSTSLPYITRNMVIGEIETYYENLSGKSYIFSNSFIVKSYTKNGNYNDSFFLEDIVGENRIPQQQSAIAMGENGILDSPIDNYHEKKGEENGKKANMDAKKEDFSVKQQAAEEKRGLYNAAKIRSDEARADAEQETDPDAKASKEAWATELEANTARLLAETESLEQIANDAESDYRDAKAEYESARSDTVEAYNAVRAAYIDTFSQRLLSVPSKEGNFNHHKANCPALEQVVTYNNDIFCAYRLDVDNDANGDNVYSVNGHRTAFHLHTAPETLHLRYYDISSRYYPAKSMTSPTLFGWEHQLLHYTYESTKYNVGVVQYPLLDTVKKDYDIWDELAHRYKTFQCFSRSGTGGDSVNTVNNVSTAIPLIFYVERDDEVGDTWSATGHTNIVNYVNMYNMGTGTMFHPQQHNADKLFGCYNLWRRRMEITPWNPHINDDRNTWTEVWGFGGYMGIAFNIDLKDDLTELRQRVVV